MSQHVPAGAAGWAAALRRVVASPYLLLALTMLFWASNVVLSRGLRAEIPLIGLSFWRWSTAALLLLPFSLPYLRGRWPEIARQWRRLAVLGLLLVVSGNTVLYVAVGHTEAINVAIVNAAQPMITVCLAWFILRDAISKGRGLGIALSLAGVLAIISRGDAGVLLTLNLNPGDLWMVVAILSWGLYAVLLKRWPIDLHPVALLQLVMTFGALGVLPFYLWEAMFERAIGPDPVTVAMVLYLAVFASIAGVMFFNLGIAAIGPGKTAMFINLIPVYVTVLAVLFLGEAVQGFHLLGFALIFAGIYLMVRRRLAVS